MFGTFTSEQLKENLIKASLARQAKKAEREANLQRLKTNYLDMPHWQQLASLYNVRMPMAGVAADAKQIRKALKKCNVDIETFNEHYTSVKYFVENNSLWSAQAITGLILEMKHEGVQKDM